MGVSWVFLLKWSFWGVLGVPPFKETPICFIFPKYIIRAKNKRVNKNNDRVLCSICLYLELFSCLYDNRLFISYPWYLQAFYTMNSWVSSTGWLFHITEDVRRCSPLFSMTFPCCKYKESSALVFEPSTQCPKILNPLPHLVVAVHSNLSMVKPCYISICIHKYVCCVYSSYTTHLLAFSRQSCG